MPELDNGLFPDKQNIFLCCQCENCLLQTSFFNIKFKCRGDKDKSFKENGDYLSVITPKQNL